MEFKLKEGWFDYFMSGAGVGALAVLLYFLYSFQEELRMDVWIILGILIIALFSILDFVRACRVKRREQNEKS